MLKKIFINLRGCVSKLNLSLGFGILTLALFLIFFSASALGKNVTVNVDGEEKQIFVFSKTVSEALKNAGVEVTENDRISDSPESDVYNGQIVYVEKAFPVTFTTENNDTVIYTTKKTVSEFLADNNIPLEEHDAIVPALEDIVSKNEVVILSKGEVETIVETQSIPFETKTVKSDVIEAGKTVVKTEGEYGQRKIIYKVVKRENEIISKTVTNTEIVKNPVAKVIENGTFVNNEKAVPKPAVVQATVASRSGDKKRSSRMISMKATAYDNSFESNGVHPGQSGYGLGASGMALKWGVVAVDPKVIPLGTRLYIETADGSIVYGDAVAGDTGGAIKGNKIDLFMDTKEQCKSFGVRQVNVYILE